MMRGAARCSAAALAWSALAVGGAWSAGEVAAGRWPASAEDAAPLRATEYELKAAFLYNFVVYTEWPSDAFAKDDAPFVVAVVGTDPFGSDLDDAFEAKSKGAHRVELRRHRAVADLQACHVLFVARSEERRLAEVLRAPIGARCLVVGDSAGLAGNGAMLGFFLDEKKVRFEADPAAAERAGLTLSSKLLKLARVIQKEGQG
jgi:hypothetical protein